MLVLTKPNEIRMFRLLALRSALKLELLGMKHSKGSVYTRVKREFGLRGNKKSVYTQFCEFVEQEKSANIPSIL